MAFCAILSELVLVHIPVAIRAASMRYALENPGFTSIPASGRMTFGTIHFLVFAKQPEAGVIMVEPGCRAEFVEPMAGSTIRTQIPQVKIRVTIRTLLAESQVGTGSFP